MRALFCSDLGKYFELQGQDYICSRPDDNGMHSCSNLPALKIGKKVTVNKCQNIYIFALFLHCKLHIWL